MTTEITGSLTPGQILALVHIHVFSTYAKSKALDGILDRGLVHRDDTKTCINGTFTPKYKMTPLGKAWIIALTSIPTPKLVTKCTTYRYTSQGTSYTVEES